MTAFVPNKAAGSRAERAPKTFLRPVDGKIYGHIFKNYRRHASVLLEPIWNASTEPTEQKERRPPSDDGDGYRHPPTQSRRGASEQRRTKNIHKMIQDIVI